MNVAFDKAHVVVYLHADSKMCSSLHDFCEKWSACSVATAKIEKSRTKVRKIAK